MRVLLIEDTTQLAGPVAQQLRDEHGHDVQRARDPLEARSLTGPFDVVVVDLLFEHLSLEFDRRRLGRRVRPTRDRLLVTGLTAVTDFLARPEPSGIVLWTSGEANRRLHLLYAEEELGIRAFCSKSSGTGKADVLNAAIAAAAAGRPHVDPVLSAYLPGSHGHPISRTIFREEKHRAIWRAVALGAHSREEIAELTGHPRRTIGNLMPELLAELLTLDPGIQAGKPLNEVVRYANRNWEFFLDDAVRRRFP
ncbi:hypothetical protein Q5425_37670 [Amycolatopsis sp. A133]|uniref:hypothetical protein n=1 Tax=Amycolatopsis sp. A133 TaxID=3064472 RepID=UPI0027F00BB6|nr:hypothetical protein [Amycolatopsis sp. A133]MDQ7809485.1 hypothetical protein [Amycolatopsis sp. A133]